MSKQWFTTAELAQMGLIGLPNAQNRIAEIAKSQKWNERLSQTGEPLARKRQARGGGFEYHIDLFPLATQADIKNRLKEGSKKPLSHSEKSDWTWFDSQTEKTKIEAYTRLNIINKIDEYRRNMTLTRAIEIVSIEIDVSVATLWVWWGMIEGVAISDRIVALAPRRQGGGKKAEIHPDDWQFFKSDYLRPTPTAYTGCYARTLEFAKSQGRSIPHIKTFIRKIEAEIPKDVIVLKRKGARALAELTPAQKRSVAHMHAMQMVNIDGHKWDVFVKFPAKNGQKERIGRPISVVIQDIYSRKILAWRTGAVEDVILTRLAFADLFKNYGIPNACLLDNGRAFASKMITGGAKTRFRFKIKDEDPLGLLTALGIKTHWATPGHGQAKPIERSFRDLEERISKHPLCEGAYTGNHIDRKPDNHGERAVDLADFELLIANGIAEHNARIGRRTETAKGDSFDAVFEASYSQNPIGRATPEQLRLALLAAEHVRTDKKTGAISLADGNVYHHRELIEYAGQNVTIRFDPDNLHTNIFVYKQSGEFICEAELKDAWGFDSLEGSKDQAKQVNNAKKLAKKAADAQELLKAKELARLLERPSDPTEPQKPNIIRPIQLRQNRGQSAVRKVEQEVFNNNFDDAIARLRTSGANEPSIFKVFEGGLAPKNGGNAT